MATRARGIDLSAADKAGISPAGKHTRARAARIPNADADALTADAMAEPFTAEPVTGERRYSFNALLTIGIAGFLLGRLCSR
ncbi:hypothetical protein MKI84_00015 [Ancylobacter sp. A5.8]|uniref:hypothetical protein n=1 Tax=Ancylobacter gelatini TaxID=2919920 RepID=UPI001F4D98B3|nr:hypothetical protein [Ancylobacter gelatini]MCJ8141299.1 hypothetical protein [Ancylobacter gelatini]